ncbi:MAG: hypothetical protein JWN01_1094 [Patescibacteria group bacterium]|nr:hypothetical protein [Patescibacteria group bacterium]
MNRLIFVTGASGSGKTTALKQLEQTIGDSYTFFYFDSVGVPTPKEMEKQYGSGEEWQRQTTIFWTKKMMERAGDTVPVLDGQMRLAFITDACTANGVSDYTIILVDCDDAARRARLVGRAQEELANEQMMNWARYLRDEANSSQHAVIIDNSAMTVDQTCSALLEIIEKTK